PCPDEKRPASMRAALRVFRRLRKGAATHSNSNSNSNGNGNGNGNGKGNGKGKGKGKEGNAARGRSGSS
ncbi:hypothetical protein, partial [Lysobacter sp. Hz 25]|uniref:hypothetical protein n=1 Tax=Lysobacter sp. Hz 25 TaxID=3383698 RepID=UPI0038D38FB3